MSDLSHLEFLDAVLAEDAQILRAKEENYKGSWKRRGGAGAFMVLARKWDRLEAYLADRGWDIFEASLSDPREEGLREDFGDLRRYLALVECECRRLQIAQTRLNDDGWDRLPGD